MNKKIVVSLLQIAAGFVIFFVPTIIENTYGVSAVRFSRMELYCVYVACLILAKTISSICAIFFLVRAVENLVEMIDDRKDGK